MTFYAEEWKRLAGRLGLAEIEPTFIQDPALTAEPELDDMFSIHATPETCCITGSNNRSILMGVYRYFYHLGIRFLGPGRQYEWFPNEIDTRSLTWDVSIQAGYRHRGVCIEGADSETNILDMIDWLPKIGMNSFFVQFREPTTFLDRWYAHIGNPLREKESFDTCTISRQIDAAMQIRGLRHHRVGHGWTGAVLGTEAEGWDPEQAVPTEEQLYYTAEVGGKRGFFSGIPLNTNLCMSNEMVQQKFTDEVVQYAKGHPEVDDLHVWLADDCNNHCECENCRKQSPTDHYVDLLNRIDEALSKEGLNTKIVFLLYLELLWAPKTKRLRNPNRFVMMFAPISRSFESGYRIATDIPQTPAFRLNHIALPVKVEENIAFLHDWQQNFTGDSFDYDYHLGRAHFGDPAYMRISRLLNEDIYALKGLHLNGMIACQELRAGFPHFLPNYVMGMTLLEPAFSFGDLEDEYFMAAYGPYAKDVMTYLEKLSALTSPDWFNGKGPRRREDLVTKYRQALHLAETMQPQIKQMTSDHPVTSRFLDILRYHNRYTQKYLKTMIARLTEDEDSLKAAFADFSQLICENEADFQECLDVYRIHEVMRNYTGIG